MPRNDFLEKFNDYYVFQCGLVDELVEKHLTNESKPKKEKNRIFNKRSIKVFLNNVSEYFGECYTEEQLIRWVIYRFGYTNAKKLVHYRLLLRFRKSSKDEVGTDR